jgi:hypothetical protein
VPMKVGDIGEEMVATAIALAKEHGEEIEAITVVRVPREFELLAATARRRGPGRRLPTRHACSVRITGRGGTDVVRDRSGMRSWTRRRPARSTHLWLLSPLRRQCGFLPTVDSS